MTKIDSIFTTDEKKVLFSSDGKVRRISKQSFIDNKIVFDKLFKTVPFLKKSNNIKEHVFCILNNITEEVQCFDKDCTNKCSLYDGGKNTSLRYKKYCSKECARKNKKEIVKQLNNTHMKNNGTTSNRNLHIKNFKNYNKDYIISHFMYDNQCDIDEMMNYYNINMSSAYKKLQALDIEYVKTNLIINHITNIDQYSNKNFIVGKFIHNDHFMVWDFCNYFNVSNATAYKKIKSLGIKYSKAYGGKSNKEKMFMKKIIKLLDKNNVTYTVNDRSIINPYELDLYIDNYKIAIEFNGLYWHSLNSLSGRKNFLNTKYKHAKKSFLCKDKNIRLLHVYDRLNDDIIYNIVKDIVDKQEQVLPAKDTVIIDFDIDNGNWLENTYQIVDYVEPTIIKNKYNYKIFNSGYLIYKRK